MMKNSFVEFCSTRYSSKVSRKYDEIGILFDITWMYSKVCRYWMKNVFELCKYFAHIFI